VLNQEAGAYPRKNRICLILFLADGIELVRPKNCDRGVSTCFCLQYQDFEILLAHFGRLVFLDCLLPCAGTKRLGLRTHGQDINRWL